jgi:hypothetical protein
MGRWWGGAGRCDRRCADGAAIGDVRETLPHYLECDRVILHWPIAELRTLDLTTPPALNEGA